MPSGATCAPGSMCVSPNTREVPVMPRRQVNPNPHQGSEQRAGTLLWHQILSRDAELHRQVCEKVFQG